MNPRIRSVRSSQKEISLGIQTVPANGKNFSGSSAATGLLSLRVVSSVLTGTDGSWAKENGLSDWSVPELRVLGSSTGSSDGVSPLPESASAAPTEGSSKPGWTLSVDEPDTPVGVMPE